MNFEASLQKSVTQWTEQEPHIWRPTVLDQAALCLIPSLGHLLHAFSLCPFFLSSKLSDKGISATKMPNYLKGKESWPSEMTCVASFAESSDLELMTKTIWYYYKMSKVAKMNGKHL
ncbi:hypothetical protein XENOCAPTIV_026116 [Xenoophorus captivus]|uniref:Uncharacterized protein n=1 Tax=Xenoophorus captivus TaxID=1517983 RepID=A0ABV0RCW1_9TELE